MYYAALDFGSNTTLLLIATQDSRGTLTEVEELSRTTRLGRGVDATGRLAPDAIMSTLNAAGEFASALRSMDKPVKGVAVATSAVRDADNREAFLQPCQDLLGTRPVVLSGEEEARTIFMGAVSDNASGRPCLVIDIGGGSSEVAVGIPNRSDLAVSVNAGCVRLAEKFGLTRAASDDAIQAARLDVREICRNLKAQVEQRTPVDETTDLNIIVTGGTATTLAAYILGAEKYDRARVHGLTASETQVREAIQATVGLSADSRAALPGIPPGRAPVWPAGLIILSEILRGFKKTSFRISTRGLRFGLAVRLQSGDIHPTLIS